MRIQISSHALILTAVALSLAASAACSGPTFQPGYPDSAGAAGAPGANAAGGPGAGGAPTSRGGAGGTGGAAAGQGGSAAGNGGAATVNNDFTMTLVGDDGQAEASVLPSASATFRVDIARGDGFTGDVTITVDGLPMGVTASSETIAAGASSATVTLQGAPGAVAGAEATAAVHAASGALRKSAFLSAYVRGVPGQPDTTYGGGTGLFAPSTAPGVFHSSLAMSVQNGAITSAGVITGASLSLTRTTALGALDASFGTAGIATTTLPVVSATAIVVQQSGRMVLSGSCPQGTSFIPCLAAVRADATTDMSFGQAGVVSFDPSLLSFCDLTSWNSGQALDVRVLADDSLVSALGSCLVRIAKDGVVDSSFGVQGAAKAGFSIESFAPDATGRLVAIGDKQDPSAPPMSDASQGFLTRFTTAGDIDAAFGTAGVSLMPAALSTGESFTMMTVDVGPTGTILSSGSWSSMYAGGSASGEVLAEVDANGAAVSTFGPQNTNIPHAPSHPGLASIPLGNDKYILRDSKLLSDGSAFLLFATFRMKQSVQLTPGLVKITPDGTLDANFGGASGASFSFLQTNSKPANLTILPKRRVLVAGFVRATGGGFNPWAARFWY